MRGKWDLTPMMRRVNATIWLPPDRRANRPRPAMEEDADILASIPGLLDPLQILGGLFQLVPGTLLGAITVGATFRQSQSSRSNLQEQPAS